MASGRLVKQTRFEESSDEGESRLSQCDVCLVPIDCLSDRPYLDGAWDITIPNQVRDLDGRSRW